MQEERGGGGVVLSRGGGGLGMFVCWRRPVYIWLLYQVLGGGGGTSPAKNSDAA